MPQMSSLMWLLLTSLFLTLLLFSTTKMYFMFNSKPSNAKLSHLQTNSMKSWMW